MKKAIFAILTFLQISVMAYASEYTMQGAYVGGIAGANFLQFDSKSSQGLNDLKTNVGYNLGVFAGYKFVSCANPHLNVRLEGEFSYRRNSLKSVEFQSVKYRLHGSTSSFAYMANAYYDFETNTKWTPYVGIGIGHVHANNKLRINGVNYRKSSNGFASQYIGGVAYRVAEGMDVGVEYRYLLARKHANEHTTAITLKQYF